MNYTFRKFHSITFDFSRSLHSISSEYSKESEQLIRDGFDRMFAGDRINLSENRAVAHYLTRDLKEYFFTSEDFTTDRKEFFQFVNKFWEDQNIKGYKHILSVGIGGSYLGTEMIYQAMQTEYSRKLPVRFISNIDPEDFKSAIEGLDSASTLVIFASKTFTTQETLSNFNLIRDWFNNDQLFFENSVAVTAMKDRATALGFMDKNVLSFSESIGGRFSISSAIGLPLALSYGLPVFMDFLSGMNEVDIMIASKSSGYELFLRHVLEHHLNVARANLNILAVLPYSHGLQRFPAYLQQLFMESLGKQVTREGEPIVSSGIVIFGEAGTGSQHSFMQFLHQGTKIIPAEFILVIPKKDHYYKERLKLFLNGVAQADALAKGNNAVQAGAENSTFPHKFIPGGRPSTLIILDRLDARTLGILTAWYEHLVVALSFLWDVNAFDQWGVELGKRMAISLETENSDEMRPETKILLSDLGLII